MTKEENYFSWDNFDEIAELKEHFSFMEDMLQKYTWEESHEKKFAEQLESVKAMQNRGKITVCVLGEASTGKSSFINALLREDLLACGVLQWTTRIATVIEYAENHMLTVHFKTGEKKEILCTSGMEELHAKLEEYTSSEQYADEISKVFAGLPAQILEKGFVIIDTPGLGVKSPWDDTKYAKSLTDVADAVIVLTDINKALPQSLLNFVRHKLSDCLEKCFFIATKCDVIKKGDDGKEESIETVLNYIRKKLEGDYPSCPAKVWGYAAREVLDNCDGEGEHQNLIALSVQTEKNITDILRQREFFARKKKQLTDIQNLYNAMAAQMEKMSDVYEQRIVQFEELRNPMLTDYLYRRAEICEKRYREIIEKTRRDGLDEMYAAGLERIRWLTYASEQKKERELQRSADLREPDCCAKSKSDNALSSHDIRRLLITKLEEGLREFREEIENRFRELKILRSNLPDVSDIAIADSMDFSVSLMTDDMFYDSKGKADITQGKKDLQTQLVHIMNKTIYSLDEFVSSCLDDGNGIFRKEVKKYIPLYIENYESAVNKWYTAEKKAEYQQKKDVKEALETDGMRVHNRCKNAESVALRLQNKQKGM